jgi:hypothetical protein
MASMTSFEVRDRQEYLIRAVQYLRMSGELDRRVEVESTLNDSYGLIIMTSIRHVINDAVEPGETVRLVIPYKGL